LPAIGKDRKLPDNTTLSETLKQRLSFLALPLQAGGNDSVGVSKVSGKSFAIGTNDKHLQTLNFQFTESSCLVSMIIDSVRSDFSFGSGKWITGETNHFGPNLLRLAKAHFTGLQPAKVAGSYGWKDGNTLELVLRYIESPHTETITCKFDEKNISVGFHYSTEPDNEQPEIKGVVRN